MEIRCPQCDAVIKTGIEHKIVKCPYCGINIYYEKDKVLTKESIKPIHNSQVAQKLLENQTNKKLKVKMEYFPFYRIQKGGQTIFVPGKKSDLIGINRYLPQGDRITLNINVPPPEYTIDQALEKIGVEKTKSVGLIYSPFFTARDSDTLYFVDAVKGIILSNKLSKQGRISKNQHPFALLSFSIVMLAALFSPTLPFKLISVVLITLGFYYYDKGRQNA
jgi:hypothetical protein